MDDNIWEYPFGDLDDDDDMFCRLPDKHDRRHAGLPASPSAPPHL